MAVSHDAQLKRCLPSIQLSVYLLWDRQEAAHMLITTTISGLLFASSGPAQFDVRPGAPYVTTAPPERLARPPWPDGPFLFGAGKLDFSPDPADYPASEIDGEYGNWGQAEITIDPSGAVTKCYAVSDNSRSAWVTERLCPSLVKTAKFKFDYGFALDAPHGYLTVSLEWKRRDYLNVDAGFVGRAQGDEIYVRYYPAGLGRKTAQCEFNRFRLSPEDSERLCKKMTGNRAFQKALSKARKQPSNGTQYGFDAVVWLSKEAITDQPVKSVISWYEDANPYHFNPAKDRYQYPPVPTQAIRTMLVTEGRLVLKVTANDRPDFAKQHYLGGVTTISLDLASDGSLLSCRPLRSSESAALDWHACKLAMARGRYVLKAGRAIPENAYVLHDVNWDTNRWAI
jgi:hypothetical protein